MDIDCRIGENDSGNRDEMLSQTPWHLIQRSHFKCWGTEQNHKQHEDLMTTVKRRKVRWYGHVTGSTGLAKTMLQSYKEKEREEGRERDGRITSRSEQERRWVTIWGKQRTEKMARAGCQMQWCPHSCPNHRIGEARNRWKYGSRLIVAISQFYDY